MTADEIETRIALVAAFTETRDIMRKSGDQVRRRFDKRAALTHLKARSPGGLPALPAPVRTAPVTVDLTAVEPITERDLATGTGLSLRIIRKAIANGEISAISRKGLPRVLAIASVAMWLHGNGISPAVLLDMYREPTDAENV